MSKPTLTVVEKNLPDPPYPADTQSGTFSLDIEVHRLLQSDTWCLLDSTLQAWALKAWVVSWSQTPCGAFRDKDEIIAAKLGCDQNFLKLHRDSILRNWYLCSDGRIYHPVISEKVLTFIETRGKWRNKKKQQRMADVQGESQGSLRGVPGVSPPSSYSSSSSSSYKNKIHCTRKVAHTIPENWQPNEANSAWLNSSGLHGDDVRRLVVEFRDYWREVGKRYQNWDLVFRRNPIVKSEIYKKGKSRVNVAEGAI